MISGGISIDDQFLEDLDCKGLLLLLRTLIHESIHRSQPFVKPVADASPQSPVGLR